MMAARMRGSQNLVMCSAIFADAVAVSCAVKNLPIWLAMYTNFCDVAWAELSGWDMGAVLFLDAFRM